MILKEIPIYERPREKVLHQGIKYLSNTELLAIILRTGTKDANVLRVSEEILYKLSTINDLSNITLNELTSIKGIGTTKAITILACVELGMRIVNNTYNEVTIRSSNSVYNHIKKYFLNVKEEHLYGVYLNAKGVIISTQELTVGTISSTLIDSDVIFKWYYKLSASAVILVHNHPSGDPTPSIADLKKTEEVIKKAKLLGINVLDHMIVGNTYYSMREHDYLHKNLFSIFKK